MVNRNDYNDLQVRAAKSVLLELGHALGQYRDHFVVIGGWVPELILQDSKEKHVGSIDVDIAFDHREIGETEYKLIHDILISLGYEEGKQPFIFLKKFRLDDQEVVVEVDLLSGEYNGTDGNHRTQKIQNIHTRKARGADLVFTHNQKVIIKGRLPSGSKDSTEVRVSSVPAFIVMKAFALRDRLKQKDAYDIIFCLKNFPGGIDELISRFKPILKNGLTLEALNILEDKFSSVDSLGPEFAAEFESLSDREEISLLKRDAFERVQYFLKGLSKGN